MQVAVTA